MNLRIIAAGAGSGKTYTLTNEMADLLTPDQTTKKAAVRASGIIATTFTNKAAAELKERVRIKLLERELSAEADELGNAMIGTVHAIGVQLLKRFAFEAGVSPTVDIIADTDHQLIFNQSLATVLSEEMIEQMNSLTTRLGFQKKRPATDWRTEMRNLVNVARSNNFDVTALEESCAYSIESFVALLPEISKHDAAYFEARLVELLDTTLENLHQNDDTTKGKTTLLGKLKGFRNALTNRGYLNWHDWAAITKLSPPKHSRDDCFDLIEFAKTHTTHPSFRGDIAQYVTTIFDTAIAAIREYQAYKKARGLIDYTDMEVMILELLENPLVLEVLQDEIDLLLVDEFQDTNPIQLQIFLKLTQIAKQAIWVGDPKQSIYGFRGAAPELMEAVMTSTTNIHDLPKSWRSRQAVVDACNGLFVKAFEGSMEPKRVALEAAYKTKEEPTTAPSLDSAIYHWHYDFEGNRPPGQPWTEKCMARSIAEVLEGNYQVRIKGSSTHELRPLEPCDIAILCRSNRSCQAMAAALHEEGLKASIAREGVLQTAEAALLLACLRFVLNKHDALSIAEIMLLASQENIGDILANRMDYLAEEAARLEAEQASRKQHWYPDNAYIQLLLQIRLQSQELSAAEILNWVIERLDINRIVATWNNPAQRLANVDALRKLATDYEDSCTRLHSAATLGGFLLWLEDLADNERDMQGSGASREAVTVMTYHKSKGLEWPFVICHSLDSKLRDSIWGFRIFSTVPTIDIQQPLANRLLCYWINPYADQVGKTDLEEAVKATPAFLQAQKEALAEEARVLYVGLTRARDYLVFPTVKKKEPLWLNRVYHQGNESLPSLDKQSNELLWTWEDQLIPIKNKIFNFGKNPSSPTLATNEYIDYLAPRQGSQRFVAAQADFGQLFGRHAKAIEGKQYIYATPLPLAEGLDYLQIQSILKTFILADDATQPLETREKIAASLLDQYHLSEQIRVKDLIYHSNSFYDCLSQKLKVENWQKHVNFVYQKDKQTLQTTLDMVATNSSDLLVVLQSSQQVGAKVNEARSREEAATLTIAKQQLGIRRKATDSLALLWRPLEGKLTEFSIDKKEQQGRLF